MQATWTFTLFWKVNTRDGTFVLSKRRTALPRLGQMSWRIELHPLTKNFSSVGDESLEENAPRNPKELGILSVSVYG